MTATAKTTKRREQPLSPAAAAFNRRYKSVERRADNLLAAYDRLDATRGSRRMRTFATLLALDEALSNFGADELELISALIERLSLGRARYGNLDLLTDKRNFQHEAIEEVLDALLYSAAELVRRSRSTTTPEGGARFTAALVGRMRTRAQQQRGSLKAAATQKAQPRPARRA